MRDRTPEPARKAQGRVLLVGEQRNIEVELAPRLSRLDCTITRAHDEAALWERVGVERPELVVLDVDLTEPLGGIRVAHALHEQLELRVVYLSEHADARVVERAKRTRPYGYLLKPVRAIELGICLELALYRAGRPTTTQRALLDDAQDSALSALTGRERDVLRMIAQGHTSKDIASTLAIAKATVDTYRGRLSEKLGAKSRAELVRIARNTGLLD